MPAGSFRQKTAKTAPWRLGAAATLEEVGFAPTVYEDEFLDAAEQVAATPFFAGAFFADRQQLCTFLRAPPLGAHRQHRFRYW